MRPRIVGMLSLILLVGFAIGVPAGLSCSSPGDLDKNGVVDFKDLLILLQAFGSYPGHPRWNPRADLNDDQIVNILDVVILIRNLS